jgi:hypothetical protein
VRSVRDLTRSPGLMIRRNGGLFVVAGSGSRLLARPASAVVDGSLPTRAGFTP